MLVHLGLVGSLEHSLSSSDRQYNKERLQVYHRLLASFAALSQQQSSERSALHQSQRRQDVIAGQDSRFQAGANQLRQ